MLKTIYFDSEMTVSDKVKREMIIKDVVGEENVCELADGYTAPYITVRCTKEQWEDIQLKANVDSIYIMW